MRKPNPPTTTITFDADGKVLGRLATQVAVALRGKNLPSFRPDTICGSKVVVTNASGIRVTGNKATDKMYGHFSGYAGGLRLTSFREKLKTDPVGLFTLAVKRMLPDNRTPKILLRRLTVKP